MVSRFDWILATLSGALLAASQPAGIAAAVWVGLAPLLLAIDGKPLARRAALALLTAMVWAWGTVGYWLPSAFRAVPFDGPTSFLLTQATVASGIIAFIAFTSFAGSWRSMRLRPLSVPALWVALEYLRASLTGGSPWALLGHSLYSWPRLIQIADVAGVYGVSFLICGVNVVVASWGLTAPRRVADTVIAITLIAGALLYGEWRLRATDGGTDSIAIQSGFPAWPFGLEKTPQQRLDDLIRISSQAPADPAAVLVWPENALRFDIQEDSEISDALISFVQQRRQYLIAGLHRHQREHGQTRYYNSAVAIAPEGSIVGVADKRLLVPMAESRWRWLPSVAEPFSAGRSWVPVTVRRRKIGILMCFESIFPEPARVLAQQGALLLVNPTNDEILAGGAAQLAAMAVFRSVENRIPLVHASTVGVSLIVDRYGRIIASATDQATVLSTTVASAAGGTWYTAQGDLFAYLCCALSGAALVFRYWNQLVRRRTEATAVATAPATIVLD